MKYDYAIVGAGFAGSVCAQQLAAAGKRVLLVEKRPHIGGNAYDKVDANGVLIHPYGPHIFHTNSRAVFIYLSQFTNWRFYEHQVLAKVDEKLLPIPINRLTVNELYGVDLDEEGVRLYLESVRLPRDEIRTSEDVVLGSVGEDLCNKFFRGYTRKQWGMELSDLSAGVASRVPTRVNDDCRYFTDTFQFMPADGYTKMFKKMLSSDLIDVRLNTDFSKLRTELDVGHIIYTGPIDDYFDHKFGKLPYRSLSFEHQYLPETETFQQVGTVNYPNDEEYTRITEFKHLTGQQCQGTSIVKEYPKNEGEPYYPIPRAENDALYKKYVELAEQEKNVSFVGRLAQYKYYNMDQVVAAALKLSKTLLEGARK